MEKVTVIGGGNGGFATAADLTIRGHQVTLFLNCLSFPVGCPK